MTPRIFNLLLEPSPLRESVVRYFHLLRSMEGSRRPSPVRGRHRFLTVLDEHMPMKVVSPGTTVVVGHADPTAPEPGADLGPEPEFDPETDNLYQFAKDELQRAGLFDQDADYGGMIGQAVLDLMQEFCKQGHSGFSASMVRELFDKLASWKPLSDISSDPSEWNDVSDMADEPMWQNTRRSSSFSRDGGKTWYDINDPSLNNGDIWHTEEQ